MNGNTVNVNLTSSGDKAIAAVASRVTGETFIIENININA